MVVKCIKGFEPIIFEGEFYEVQSKTLKGHYMLKNITPPFPYTCFHKSRFKEINLDDIDITHIENIINQPSIID